MRHKFPSVHGKVDNILFYIQFERLFNWRRSSSSLQTAKSFTFSRVVVVHSDYQKSHVVFKVSISLFTLHVATSKLKSMEWTQIPLLMKTIELQILILIFKITLRWLNDVNYDILKGLSFFFITEIRQL